jgi:hypothetical protein
MSFADPTVLAYDGANINLARVSSNGFATKYYGVSGTRRFTLNVSHVIPGRDKTGESHMARLDVEHYDGTTGAYLYTTSVWIATRTDGGPQVDEESEDACEGLVDLMIDANITKLVTRQS